jgi:hypothetical protein
MRLSRDVLRWTHLAATPLLGAVVYSPALRGNETFLALVQWGVFPLAAAAGLGLWLGPRMLRRRNAAAPTSPTP